MSIATYRLVDGLGVGFDNLIEQHFRMPSDAADCRGIITGYDLDSKPEEQEAVIDEQLDVKQSVSFMMAYTAGENVAFLTKPGYYCTPSRALDKICRLPNNSAFWRMPR